jgi:hypothetical protein
MSGSSSFLYLKFGTWNIKTKGINLLKLLKHDSNASLGFNQINIFPTYDSIRSRIIKSLIPS